jgi:hypothetical protein
MLMAVIVSAVLACGAWQAATGAARTGDLPKKLSDAEFWSLISAFSEAGGSFPSNNFVSNETAYQTVVPRLKTRLGKGGVYLGVGPDQNFTYISVLEPKIAFIVDIRRQNLLQHLLYKALIEKSPTRAEFLSRLFSRPRPRDLPDHASIDAHIAAFAKVSPSVDLFVANLADVQRQLVDRHKFELSEHDLSTIKFVYQAFFDGGPDLTYAGPRAVAFADRLLTVNIYPTYGDLVVAADEEGVQHGYLATPERYKVLRDLQMKNLIVPVVGDFAGPTALRAVGAYLQSRGATVSAIYTSNVEQYLFQNNVWRSYYDNVAELPIDAKSTFIRAVFANQGLRFGVTFDPNFRPTGNPVQSWSLLSDVTEVVDAARSGALSTYLGVINLSK